MFPLESGGVRLGDGNRSCETDVLDLYGPKSFRTGCGERRQRCLECLLGETTIRYGSSPCKGTKLPRSLCACLTNYRQRDIETKCSSRKQIIYFRRGNTSRLPSAMLTALRLLKKSRSSSWMSEKETPSVPISFPGWRERRKG